MKGRVIALLVCGKSVNVMESGKIFFLNFFYKHKIKNYIMFKYFNYFHLHLIYSYFQKPANKSKIVREIKKRDNNSYFFSCLSKKIYPI